MSEIIVVPAASVVPARRFAHSASTVGVGAVLTSHKDSAGDPMSESWAPTCLPIIGGRSASQAGPVVWPTAADYAAVGLADTGPVLQFDLAVSKITGRQIGAKVGKEEFETIIHKKVTNLNILNRLNATIDVDIKFEYRRRPTPSESKQRDPVRVSIKLRQFDITDLVSASPPAPLLKPIDLNRQIPRSAGHDFKHFRKEIDDLRPGMHHKHEHGEKGPGGHKQGYIYTALAEPVDQFTYDDDEHALDFGKLDIPGLGEIYVGEWVGQPYWQSLTFLRVELDDTGVQDARAPNGIFTGQIVIDDDGNGSDYP